MNILNYINGEMKAANNGSVLDNYNPATGSVYGNIPNSDASDVADAYEAAALAFPSWSNTPAEERFKILNAIAEGIDSLRDTLAMAESNDQGKPLWLAKNEMIRAGQNFRFFATGIQHFSSESHYMEGLGVNYTTRRPIGVVACIAPWNLPLYLFSWKIAPALVAGNCVVAKPTEVTPYTAYLLSEVCIAAGLPKGVLNIVHGLGSKIGDVISLHPDIKAISFTGGTSTGKRIASLAAPMFKKLSLELGGKNPTVIFADCNFDKMLKTVLRSAFENQGQICLCGSRIFVEASLFEQFKTDFIERVSQLTVGHPSNESTQVGALVSKAHIEKVLSFIDRVDSNGGKLLHGGKRVRIKGHEDGYYLTPTIIQVDSNSCHLNQEEIFGPVVTIMPFDSEYKVLEMANDVKYGLSATVWTNNLKRSLFFSEQLSPPLGKLILDFFVILSHYLLLYALQSYVRHVH